jgi:hypothetical protein
MISWDATLSSTKRDRLVRVEAEVAQAAVAVVADLAVVEAEAGLAVAEAEAAVAEAGTAVIVVETVAEIAVVVAGKFFPRISKTGINRNGELELLPAFLIEFSACNDCKPCVSFTLPILVQPSFVPGVQISLLSLFAV